MESLDNIREASLTEINLSIIKQFEALLESHRDLVKDIKEIWAEEIPADDITALMEVMDKLMEGQAEFVMYLRREILKSNQKSIRIDKLHRKIEALESTSLN